MNTPVIILIVIISLTVIICLATRGSEKPMYPGSEEFEREAEEQVNLKDLKRKDIECYNEVFRIAGITHYCDNSDLGVISGEARRDPENKYDKKAVLIVDANKEKILGHIAREDQKRFYNLVGDAKWMPFIGYIEQFRTDDGRNTIYGVIRVYIGQEDIVMKNAEQDWEYLNKAYKIKDLDDRAEALDRFKY
jgi:hypothetical protein